MVVALGPSALLADDYTYPYLIFTDAAGAQTTVSVASLEITFADGQLVATNGDGTTTLTLADLASMAFSETGEVTPVTPVKVESGLAFDSDVTEYTATLGEDFSGPTLDNPNGLAVTWTSSDESVATVDADGNVTLVGAGTATITVSFAGNDEYEAGEASYTITVGEYDAVRSLAVGGTVKVYAASGIFVGQFDSLAKAKAVLHKGLYVVSFGKKNVKLNIR